MRKELILCGTALSVFFIQASICHAQAPQGGQAAQQSLSEVVVTAARRSDVLQNTALSVSVLSGGQLNAQGVTDTSMLQTSVPSLQFATASGTTFVYVRGVGSAVFGAFSDNSVATYVNGVYIPKQENAVQDLFDVTDVEVLKGPQASLYGRNAMGGAILVTTNAPTNHFTAFGDVDLGNYAERRFRAGLSGPLLADGLLNGRISVVRSSHDGYQTNLTDGVHYDSDDLWAGRGTLQARPLNNLDATLTVDWSDQRGAPVSSKALNRATLPFLPAPAGRASPYSTDPWSSYHNLDAANPKKTYGASLRVNWDVGFAKLVSTTAYDRYQIGPTFVDIDDSNAALLEYRGEIEDTKYAYQDLYLISQGAGPLDWYVGGTYSKQNTYLHLPVLNPSGLGVNDSFSDDQATAIYGQVGYALTSQLKLAGSLRYTTETLGGLLKANPQSPTPTITTNKKTWTDVSPKVSLEYKPSFGGLLYLSATKGFKSGVFSPTNLSNVGAPETLWSYEGGLRSTFLDKRVKLNLTAFHYDYSNVQMFNGVISGPAVTTVIQNASGATVDGVEIEPTFAVTHYLNVGGSVTFLDPRYKSGTVLADLANAVPGRPGVAATVPVRDASGNQMIQAPKTSASVFADLHVPLGAEGSADLHADYFYGAARYFTAFQDASLRAPAYDTVNLRLTYNPPGLDWHIAGYARNLGNTLVVSTESRVPPFGTLATYAAPRTYGVELSFRF